MIDPEDQVAADIAAAEARGEDPFADKAPGEQPATTDAAPGDEPDVPDADDSAVTDEPAQAAEAASEPSAAAQPAQADDAQDDAPKPTTYVVSMPGDYKAQRTELLKAKAEAMKQLMDGELDAEEFAAKESEISDKLEDLTAQRIRAETLQEANTQTQAVYQQREIQKLIRTAKADGLDYTQDPSAAKQFDTALAVISADPDNKGADYAELISEAHQMVMSRRGLKAVAPAKTTEAPKRGGPQPPQTLSGLPTAASGNAKSVERTLAELSGDDLERAFNSLPKAELDRLLKS